MLAELELIHLHEPFCLAFLLKQLLKLPSKRPVVFLVLANGRLQFLIELLASLQLVLGLLMHKAIDRTPFVAVLGRLKLCL